VHPIFKEEINNNAFLAYTYYEYLSMKSVIYYHINSGMF